MTTIKLNGAMPAGCIPEDVAPKMWRNLGGRYIGLVELHVAQRTQPAVGETGEPTAQLRVTQLELASSTADDELLRTALRARYESRTSLGTIEGVLAYPGRTKDGELKDALAVMHNQLQEEQTLKGFPVVVSWADDDSGDLIVRVSQKPADDQAGAA